MDSCAEKKRMEIYEDRCQHDKFMKLCGIEIVRVTETGAIGVLPLQSKVFNANGDIHGGALFSLGDAVASAAAYVWGKQHLGEDTGCTTASASFNYLRPVSGGERIVGKATLRKTGKTLAVVDVSIEDESGREVCLGVFTIYYLSMDRYANKN